MVLATWILAVKIFSNVFEIIQATEFPAFFDEEDIKELGAKHHHSAYAKPRKTTTPEYLDYPTDYKPTEPNERVLGDEQYHHKIPPNGLPVHRLPYTMAHPTIQKPVGYLRGQDEEEDDAEKIFPNPDGLEWGGDDFMHLESLPQRLTETKKWEEFKGLVAVDAAKYKKGEVMKNWEDDAHKWAAYSRHLLERKDHEEKKQAALRKQPRPSNFQSNPSPGLNPYWAEPEEGEKQGPQRKRRRMWRRRMQNRRQSASDYVPKSPQQKRRRTWRRGMQNRRLSASESAYLSDVLARTREVSKRPGSWSLKQETRRMRSRGIPNRRQSLRDDSVRTSSFFRLNPSPGLDPYWPEPEEEEQKEPPVTAASDPWRPQQKRRGMWTLRIRRRTMPNRRQAPEDYAYLSDFLAKTREDENKKDALRMQARTPSPDQDNPFLITPPPREEPPPYSSVYSKVKDIQVLRYEPRKPQRGPRRPPPSGDSNILQGRGIKDVPELNGLTEDQLLNLLPPYPAPTHISYGPEAGPMILETNFNPDEQEANFRNSQRRQEPSYDDQDLGQGQPDYTDDYKIGLRMGAAVGSRNSPGPGSEGDYPDGYRPSMPGGNMERGPTGRMQGGRPPGGIRAGGPPNGMQGMGPPGGMPGGGPPGGMQGRGPPGGMGGGWPPAGLPGMGGGWPPRGMGGGVPPGAMQGRGPPGGMGGGGPPPGMAGVGPPGGMQGAEGPEGDYDVADEGASPENGGLPPASSGPPPPGSGPPPPGGGPPPGSPPGGGPPPGYVGPTHPGGGPPPPGSGPPPGYGGPPPGYGGPPPGYGGPPPRHGGPPPGYGGPPPGYRGPPPGQGLGYPYYNPPGYMAQKKASPPPGSALMSIAMKKLAMAERNESFSTALRLHSNGTTTERQLTKDEILRNLRQFDDFHAPIRWVKFNSEATIDGLARVTDRKTKRNEQHIVEGELYVPVIDESMARLGVATEDPNDLTTLAPVEPPPNDSSIKVVMRSMNVTYADEREWLAYETIMGPKEPYGRRCEGASCQARCHRTGCDALCSGDTCATGCVGVNCNSVCQGPGCFSMCIGEQCLAKCDGLNCESRCWGKNCESTCSKLSCSYTANGGYERRSNVTWDQMYPEYGTRHNPDDLRQGPGNGPSFRPGPAQQNDYEYER